jgi:hypothetical protein
MEPMLPISQAAWPLSAMREDGDEIPQPSHFELVDVA